MPQQSALRQELAAAKDYERLTGEARDLRKVLADLPILATADPLPEAYESTLGRVLRHSPLGRVLPRNGRAGVALLLTVVIEIISTFGPAAFKQLSADGGTEDLAEETATRALARKVRR